MLGIDVLFVICMTAAFDAMCRELQVFCNILAYLSKLCTYCIAIIHCIELNSGVFGTLAIKQGLSILTEGAASPAKHNNLKQQYIPSCC